MYKTKILETVLSKCPNVIIVPVPVAAFEPSTLRLWVNYSTTVVPPMSSCVMSLKTMILETIPFRFPSVIIVPVPAAKFKS